MLMIKCNEVKKDPAFFDNFYKEINDKTKLKQLFTFFKQRDIQHNFNGNKSFLMNTYKQELEYENAVGYKQYIYKNVYDYHNTSIQSNTFYEQSKDWCNKNYISSNYTITAFGKEIGEIFKAYKKRTNVCYKFNFEGVSVKSILETLYNYDRKYYIYVNGLDDNFIFGAEEPYTAT
jgi:hypothetical protein